MTMVYILYIYNTLYGVYKYTNVDFFKTKHHAMALFKQAFEICFIMIYEHM